MQFLGYPIGEWSILIGVVITLGSLAIRFVGKKVKAFVDKVIEEFAENTVNPMVKSIDNLSRSFEKETDWIHNEHRQVVRRLDDHKIILDSHENRLDEHNKEIIIHTQQIKTLFKTKEDNNHET